MKRHEDQIDRRRRSLVGGAAAAGLGGVIASAVPATALADNQEGSDDKNSGKGYRLTQHVLDYYKSATS